MQSREITKQDAVWTVDRILLRIMSDTTGRYASEDWKEPHLVGMGEVMHATFRHIRDSLINGRGTHIRGFGTFTLAKKRRHPRSAGSAGEYESGHQHNSNNHHHHHHASGSCADYVVRPLFKVDESLFKVCRVREKSETPRIPRFAGSIYEAVPTAMYLNPVTIASRCDRKPSFVRAVLGDFFTCCQDIIRASVPQLIALNFHFGVYRFDTETREASFKFNHAFLQAVTSLTEQARKSNMHSSAYTEYVSLHPNVGLATSRSLRTPGIPRATPFSRRLSNTMLGQSMTGLKNPKWDRSFGNGNGNGNNRTSAKNDDAGDGINGTLPRLATPARSTRSIKSAGSARSGRSESGRSIASRLQHVQRMQQSRPTSAA